MTLNSSAEPFLKLISTMKNNSSDSNDKKSSTVSLCLGILFIAVLLQLLSFIKGSSLVFPDILSILKTFFKLLLLPSTWLYILTTLKHLLTALLVSALAAFPLGLLEGRFLKVQKFLAPLMTFLRSVPMIVLIVIIMVLVNYDFVPYITAALVLVPVISEAICEGIKSIDPELIDVYRLNSSFTPQIFMSVYLPLISGYVKQAFTVAAGLGIRIIVTAEYFVQCRNSLGKAVYQSSYFNEFEEIYAWALIMVFLILLVNTIPALFLRSKK